MIIDFDQAHMGDYFAVAGELRAAGIAGRGLSRDLGHAAADEIRRPAARSPPAIMLGGDEIAAGTVTVKDLDLGRELASEHRRQRRLEGRAARPADRSRAASWSRRSSTILEGLIVRLERSIPTEALDRHPRSVRGRRRHADRRAGAAAPGPAAGPGRRGHALAAVRGLRPTRGEEACLRPDFTVAVARQHLAHRTVRRPTVGRYFYEGKAFRVAPRGSDRAEEFLQIGVEAVRRPATGGRRRRDRRPGLGLGARPAGART